MIDDKSVLGVILARGGSKLVPRKNIREVAGKPLVAWTIETGLASEHVDRLILSSDDSEIAEVARRRGCEVPFLRPNELARDDTPSADALLHALAAVPGYDYCVLLQPTSPLRAAEDIDACIRACHREKAPACVSVSEPEESPYWMFTLGENRRIRPVIDEGRDIVRRQDLPRVWFLNGAVYVAAVDWYRRTQTFLSEETVAYAMPRERSYDIDTEDQLLFVSTLLARRGQGAAVDNGTTPPY